MLFGDVKTKEGLKKLDDFLGDNSYIEGYNFSKADQTIFETLGKAPGSEFGNAVRWYRHIASYVNEKGTASSVTGNNAAASKPGTNDNNDDDDVDLFGSDEEEDAEAQKIREERLAAYAAKKSKKPALIAKSSILLDVKPWDDETNMQDMETKVRAIEMDGLLWGASKFVPVGYGINKLQICCVIEDEKVSIDLLQEKIAEYEDVVQSVDIAAFNKI